MNQLPFVITLNSDSQSIKPRPLKATLKLLSVTLPVLKMSIALNASYTVLNLLFKTFANWGFSVALEFYEQAPICRLGQASGCLPSVILSYSNLLKNSLNLPMSITVPKESAAKMYSKTVSKIFSSPTILIKFCLIKFDTSGVCKE